MVVVPRRRPCLQPVVFSPPCAIVSSSSDTAAVASERAVLLIRRVLASFANAHGHVILNRIPSTSSMKCAIVTPNSDTATEMFGMEPSSSSAERWRPSSRTSPPPTLGR